MAGWTMAEASAFLAVTAPLWQVATEGWMSNIYGVGLLFCRNALKRDLHIGY
jgi:hypothetical protein